MRRFSRQIIRWPDKQKNSDYPVIRLSSYLLNSNSAFTLIEVLMVLGLVGVIGAISAPILGSFVDNIDNLVVVDSTTSLINQAQVYSSTRKNNTVWGVCYQGNELWLYRTSCQASNIYTKYNLPDKTTLSNMNNLEFNTLGELAAAESFTITSQTQSTQLSVSRMGAINVQ